MVVKVKNMEGKLDRERSRSEKGYISPEEFLPFLPPPFVIPQSESPFLLVPPEPRHRRTSGLIKAAGGGEGRTKVWEVGGVGQKPRGRVKKRLSGFRIPSRILCFVLESGSYTKHVYLLRSVTLYSGNRTFYDSHWDTAFCFFQ